MWDQTFWGFRALQEQHNNLSVPKDCRHHLNPKPKPCVIPIIYMYMYIYIYRYTHMYIYIYIYAYIRTHSLVPY